MDCGNGANAPGRELIGTPGEGFSVLDGDLKKNRYDKGLVAARLE
jgi:hypothetical protein